MEQFWPILWGGLGTIVMALATWLASYLTGLLSSKIKDQKLATFLTKFMGILSTCVNALTQTTVEELKKSGKFDSEAAKRVKEECIKLIKNQLAPDMIEFIKNNFGDVTEYISTQIESFILSKKQK